jgi:hypothetical protein
MYTEACDSNPRPGWRWIFAAKLWVPADQVGLEGFRDEVLGILDGDPIALGKEGPVKNVRAGRKPRRRVIQTETWSARYDW